MPLKKIRNWEKTKEMETYGAWMTELRNIEINLKKEIIWQT